MTNFAAITIAIIVSCLGGWVLDPTMGFMRGFSLTIIAQFIIGSLRDWYSRAVFVRDIKIAEAAADVEMSKQVRELVCPCHLKNRQIVPIRLDTPPIYDCTRCQKSISTDIKIQTALTTEILDLEQASTEAFKHITDSVSITGGKENEQH